MGNITKEKIEKFIACIILIGIINLPDYPGYLDNEPSLENSITKIMSYSGFKTINQFFIQKYLKLNKTKK